MIPPDQIARARSRWPRAFGVGPWRRLGRAAMLSGLAALLVYAWIDFDVSFARLWNGIARFGDILRFMFPPAIWGDMRTWADVGQALGETLAMAFLGTLFGAVAAFPLAFVGARTIHRQRWLRFGARRGFDALRSIEQVILALIFIRAFGLGPLAGLMAIAVLEVGHLAKLFSEAIEEAPPGPIESLRATGAGRLQVIRYALLPQVAPVMLSSVLYEFESNTRSSTILGIVGAGGIGALIVDRIGANAWPEVWTLILLVVLLVAAIDALSAWLRRRVIHG